MIKTTQRTIALVLSFLMITACIPTFVIAEELAEGQEVQSSTMALYRASAVGSAPETDDDWTCWESKDLAEDSANDKAEKKLAEETPLPDSVDETGTEDSVNSHEGPQPIGFLEIKLSEEQQGIEYRVRDAETDWPDEWTSDGTVATSEQGITNLQIRLTDELAEEYDVWYRALRQDGTWLDWKSNGEDAAPDNEEPLYDVQIVLAGAVRNSDIPSEGEVAQDSTEESAVNNVEETPSVVEVVQTESEEKDQAKPEEAVQVESMETEATTPSIKYRAHVQNEGWQGWVSNGALAGTTGKALRVEGFYFKLEGISGDVTCEAHVQDYGWKSPVSAGKLAGTTGESKRVEAIRLRLKGAVAKDYDIWYRSHVQNIGWQNWVSNGSVSGTSGRSYRIEAIEVLLVKKGDAIPVNEGSKYTPTSTDTQPGVYYQSHIQNIGWQKEVSNKATSGTNGQGLRMEALRIKTTGLSGGIRYKAHVQNIGWQDWSYDGNIAGTSGQGLRIEAVQIELTGNAAKNYDVYYRTHVQNVGWTSWAKNGEENGSTGCSYRLEAIQILVQSNKKAAPTNADANTSLVLVTKHLNGVDISGWDAGININKLDADFVIIKATEGVTGNLSNPAYYNPSYKTWANQALARGKLIGFYHYANGGDPIKEADWFYYAIKDYKGRAIACLDWEGQGNKLFDTGKDVEWCKKFLDRLQSKFGGTPLLYTSKYYTTKYNWSSVASKYPLWGAQYPDYNPIYGYQTDPWQSSGKWGAWGATPTIFQYTSTGVLTNNGGIKEFDFNLFYGNRNDWKALQ